MRRRRGPHHHDRGLQAQIDLPGGEVRDPHLREDIVHHLLREDIRDHHHQGDTKDLPQPHQQEGDKGRLPLPRVSRLLHRRYQLSWRLQR